MFSNLEEKDLSTVIDAMEERKFKKFDKIISQGQEGNSMFLIDSGTLDCFKLLNNNDKDAKYIKLYEPGDYFGELALLSNCPRAATIIARDDCILWELDRETFNYIVKDSAIKKREKYENFLRSVEIFKNFDQYQIMQISDSLKTIKFKKGDVIIKRNDFGDYFFIMEEGEAYATKPLKPSNLIIFFCFYSLSKIFTLKLIDSPDEIVKTYKSGDYFGELALIKNDLRAANIIANVLNFFFNFFYFFRLNVK